METTLYIENFNQLDTLERKEEYKKISSHLPVSILEVFFEEIGGKICLKKDVTKEEIETAYNLFNQDVYYAGENLSILKNMLSIVSSVNDAVTPLKKLIDLDYDIALVGGSLRDLVMGGYDIKNLKVLVSVKNNAHAYQNSRFNSEEISKKLEIEYMPERSDIETLMFIVAKTIGNKLNVKKQYLKHDLEINSLPIEKYEDFNKNCLTMIDIEDKKLPYDVTIFITDKFVSEYVKSFNFNINKIYLPFTKENIKELENLLNFCTNEKLEEIYKQIKIEKLFLKDVKERKFTLNKNGVEDNILNVLITKSYPELKDKYKEFELQIDGFEENKKEYIIEV